MPSFGAKANEQALVGSPDTLRSPEQVNKMNIAADEQCLE